MKKLILLATAFAAASTFFSCNSGEIERLRAQNDSLRSVAKPACPATITASVPRHGITPYIRN